ncbi:vancomycin resistance protein [Entomomonas moraniae]|uniref:Vancomycin resistance protein n=1 Tax=Entomomonas moraniae TaxID=2213226 RepID=A0A3Q9JK09_9GAMM|nr:VanW family protein [Entomomonas moraniae]AZS51382.1 vancomycin resistance protein [Entomomonas moraniae]
MKKPLSSYHPLLYKLRVVQKRLSRTIIWKLSKRNYADKKQENKLPYRLIKHTSKLIRKLGDSDARLQHNKIINLKKAAPYLNHIIIEPNQYFSFWKLVGRPTAERGFVEGMELSIGKARAGIGGGLCQISNLIHWMALHSPLQVIERANHSFDPFPDDGRILPFGSGAALFYNYIDLILFNPTQNTYQLTIYVAEHQLEGEILCNVASDIKYHVYQKNHRFIKLSDQVVRQNEIWQDVSQKGQGGKPATFLNSQKLYANSVRVMYPIADELITNNSHHG